MYKKIDKLLESFENTTPPTLEQTRNKIIKVFLKEYEKGKPKRYDNGSGLSPQEDYEYNGFNEALELVDSVIHEILK